MSFLLLFQNLLHELENRSLFHQKKSVHFRSSHLNTEKFPFYLLLSCCGKIPCRGCIPRSVIPHQEAVERPQHSTPLSAQEAAECHARTACSLQPGCACRMSLTSQSSAHFSQPLVRAPAASLGQFEPTPLLASGMTWLHPFLTAWCKAFSIARTVLWSVGGWFSLVFLRVGFLSFPLIYHVIHC